VDTESYSSSESELSWSEVIGFLCLFGGLLGEFKLGQSLSESSGLLLSQVMRSVLLLLVVFSCLISSLLVDHSENLGDGLSGVLNLKSNKW
jgi:hypothetical protein